MYLGTGIKTIGSTAFGASSIETMYITSIVETIDQYAFNGWYTGSIIYYVGTEAQWKTTGVYYSGTIKYDYKA